MRKIARTAPYLLLTVLSGGCTLLPPEVADAIDKASDLDETFALRVSSGSAAGLREFMEIAFPSVDDLVEGGTPAHDEMIRAFKGEPSFEDDLKLAIYAWALEEMGLTDSDLTVLQRFLRDNLTGDVYWSLHFVTHAIRSSRGYYDGYDKAWYFVSEMVEASTLGAADNPSPSARKSCGRRYLAVDDAGKPLTWNDGGTTRTIAVEGHEFSSADVPAAVRDNYLTEVQKGGGTYVNDNPEFQGAPSKQFNCAGYAFSGDVNGGKRWTADPAEIYRALHGAGLLVDVSESQAQAGDKVFYFQSGSTLPGHVAVVQSVASGTFSNSITVRNADGQSGLWQAPIDASYYTGNWLGWSARYPSRKVVRWKNGTPPRFIPDPATSNNEGMCGATSTDGGVPGDGGGGTSVTITADIDIPGYPVVFVPTRLGATNQGTFDGTVHLADLIGIEAGQGGACGQQTMPTADLLLMFDRRQITGPTTLAARETDQVFESQYGEAALNFFSMSIANVDGSPVVFESTGGSMTLTSWGTATGDRLVGSYAVAVRGTRTTGYDQYDDPIDVDLSGTIEGTFNVGINECGAP